MKKNNALIRFLNEPELHTILGMIGLFQSLPILLVGILKEWTIPFAIASIALTEIIFLLKKPKFEKFNRDFFGDNKILFTAAWKGVYFLVSLGVVMVIVVAFKILQQVFENLKFIIDGLYAFGVVVYPYIGLLGLIIVWIWLNSLYVKSSNIGRLKGSKNRRRK
jgi:hypothetical protein